MEEKPGWIYSINSDCTEPDIKIAPLQLGHETPHPAPDPVERTTTPIRILINV